MATRHGARALVPSATRRVHDWESGRRSTWLELFFDLVFVVAISRLATLLYRDHSAGGVLAFAGLLATVWWAWISFSYFADLFDEDGPLDRLAQLVAMLGAAVLAVALGAGVGQAGRLYAGTFAALFALLALLYAQAARGDPEARELCRWYVAGSSLGAALWAVSLAVPAPARYAVWGVALVANALVSGPIAYARVRSAPRQVSHMPERFGLFVIVVLGEAILGVVNAIADARSGVSAVVVAVAGFVIAACVWWLYFDQFDETAIDRALEEGRRAQVRSFLYGYGHLLIYAAVAAAGVAVRLAAESARHHGAEPPLLGAALAAVLAGYIVISNGIGRRGSASVLATKIAVAAGGIALALAGLSSALATALMAAGWVGLVVLERRQRAAV